MTEETKPRNRAAQNVARFLALLRTLGKVKLLASPAFWAVVGIMAIISLTVLVLIVLVEMPRAMFHGLKVNYIDAPLDRVRVFFGFDPLSEARFGLKPGDTADSFYGWYRDTAAKWKEGLDDDQLVQVKDFMFPTALLIGADRVLNDPVFKRDRVVSPDPKTIFEGLRPRFVWVPSYRIELDEYCVCGKDGCSTKTDVRYPKTKLLIRADTFYGNYTWRLEWREEEWYTHSDDCGDLRHYRKYEERIADRIPSEPYLPLREFAAAYGLYRDIDVDVMVQVAKAYDAEGEVAFDIFELNRPPVVLTPGEAIDPEALKKALPEMAAYIDRLLEERPDAFSGMLWPAATKAITSPFGVRIHPILGEKKFHKGIDIGASLGTPVVAVRDGVVTYRGWNGGYGQLVVLKHEGGLETYYAHLSRIDVGLGQKVSAGEQIGLIGDTGLATGPHLHFEVRADGSPIDPAYLYAKLGEIARGETGGHGEDEY
ncbi:MAG: peptidase M23B [Hydrogenibacillus schlegelii]|uniref:Peptidase M23B n=1 Tax=Hydrogenibacillus schlegelii TaxID=1484 RepID=A0A2T5G6T9_HYDSH|nr:M23 family metallopeptidase [Hydrogenibacillus schlegelii]PTQ51901.1 MAG: peptidase M23B [Hydrogenibacillus schlegelii]